MTPAPGVSGVSDVVASIANKYISTSQFKTYLNCHGMCQCKGGWGGLYRARDLEEKRLFSLFHIFLEFFFNF